MKILSDAPGMREFTVNEGRVVKRDKEGAFNVSDQLGRTMVKTGEFTVKGMNFRSAQGWECQSCGRVNVYRDKCGKCGSTDLVPEP